MQDSAVVAAVVAGDADGFVAAYDQYATSLYGYCRRVLPGPEAAEAVLDTFLIATAKLDGLRDPDRLGPWLHAVARNECLRRLGPGGEIPAAADPGDEPPETPPADLRGRVVTACADNTPAGRAHRMSVAHRAGVFGAAGFPKTIGPNGPRWWRVLRQRVRRHPGVVLAAAVVATLAATAGITVVMAAGGSHRPQASGPGLGGGVPASASGTPSGGTGRVPSPVRTAPASALPTSPAALAGATSAGPAPGRGTPGPAASPSGTSPSPSPSPSASSSPAQGYLLVAPARLVLSRPGQGQGRPGGRVSPGEQDRRGNRDGDQQGRSDHARRGGARQHHRDGGLQAPASAHALALAQGLEGEEPVEFCAAG